jgi:hypothetical protein
MLEQAIVVVGSFGAAWVLPCRQERQEKQKRKKARQASFLDKKSGLIEGLSASERERLRRIFTAYWAEGREYSFLLKDGRALQGGFRCVTDDYVQFTTSCVPISFESVSLSLPLSAIDVGTLAYLEFDADVPEWHRFDITGF